jgi:hypothetical protein
VPGSALHPNDWNPQVQQRTAAGYKNLGYLLLKAQRMAVTKTEFIVLQKAA